MPRYFLHLWDGDLLEEDREGTDLPDLSAARAEAPRFARETSRDLGTPERAVVRLADEKRSTLWMLQFSQSPGAITQRISH